MAEAGASENGCKTDPYLCDDYIDFRECIPQKLMKALRQCIECGKCVGICTAARVSPNYNSRKIVKKVLEGDESVLKDPELWECFLCNYCYMVCPKKDMNLPDLIFRLREISVKRGYAPEKLTVLTNWLDRFFKDGKIAGPNKVPDQRTVELRKIAEKNCITVMRQYIENLKKT